ncbi:2'-5' RNA ligase family protein [Amycolatopsis sp. H20-H5]|uniref:2'-5' RNA ligase family protein n=1 Tax=Amycolatopsis sp. H20-H5 TaxID=3046309 RepID=UPI002DBA5ADF|nr:2'-5' RNA ligase family protein [Amycolatopsis sp. H20-H5]MEC3977498.1 2'-5' RNA ligase family protein [Amycolatopsis sp. H20-H5]
MSSLFSALLPPADVAADLAADLAAALGAPEPSPLRWSAPENWHVTLGFYGHSHGADDPVSRSAWLAERLAGRPAIDVRLEKAGTFPGVLWLSVGGTGLTDLAHAAGAGQEDRPYRAHLTLAYFPTEEPEAAHEWVKRLAGFSSRTWTVTEAVLMRGEGGSHYRVIDRYPLNRASER